MRTFWIALTIAAGLAGCNNSEPTAQSSAATSAAASVTPAPVAQVAQAPAEAPTVDADGVPTVCRSAAETKRQCAINVANKYDGEGRTDAASRTRASADMVVQTMMGQWKARQNKQGLQAECERLLSDLQKIPACQSS